LRHRYSTISLSSPLWWKEKESLSREASPAGGLGLIPRIIRLGAPSAWLGRVVGAGARRGTGGTLSVDWRSRRDRGRPPPGGWGGIRRVPPGRGGYDWWLSTGFTRGYSHIVPPGRGREGSWSHSKMRVVTVDPRADVDVRGTAGLPPHRRRPVRGDPGLETRATFRNTACQKNLATK
jgi:hypothetical protein